MGLANLVPGMSGGTMLLATGIYPRFVSAVAEISTLRFRLPSLAVLATVIGAALLAVFLLAGFIRDWVVLHTWVAYSLFIGLTLGGVPVLWRMIGHSRPAVWMGALAGLAAMSALVLVQHETASGFAGEEADTLLLFATGVGGASAMVLPGISGSYIFVLLGQYVPILGAVDTARAAFTTGEPSAAIEPFFSILFPLAVGIALGLILVSNLVRLLLERCPNATLGTLLGLLSGAVFGLWPFRAPVEPSLGDVIGGKVVTSASIASIPVESWPVAFFFPSAAQVLFALLLVGVGFALTTAVSWLGDAMDEKRPAR